MRLPHWGWAVLIFFSLPVVLCSGCLGMLGVINHKMNVEQARIEAAKTPAQRAAEEVARTEERVKLKAITAAQIGVRSLLKSPDSAEFGWLDTSAVLIGPYATVSGTVTATNAFNAKIKHEWKAQLKCSSYDADLITVVIGDDGKVFDEEELNEMLAFLLMRKINREAAAKK